MEGLNYNNLKPLQDSLLDNIQTQIEQMEISVNLNKIKFEFDDDDAKNFISSLGKLSQVPNYKVKKHPIIVSTAKHGGSHVPGEFHGPSVLTIRPNSGDIYIGCRDGMIHVFSPDAEFISAIDTKTGSAVLGIAFNNSAIFVAFANCALRQYHISGTCIKTIQTPKKYGETRALTILNNNLLLIPLLGENPIGCITLDTMAIEPVILEKIDTTGSSVGIKSTPKGHLAILFSSTPFVVVFNIQGKILSKPLCGSIHLKSPEYFAIDSCDHFLISDDYIKIFQSNGELLHTIGGPSNPNLISLSLGIDIDSQGRIVNICGKKTNCLQVF